MVIRALGEMRQPDARWEMPAPQCRHPRLRHHDVPARRSAPSDQCLGSFYGLALPLFDARFPVEPVQIKSSDRGGISEPLSSAVPHLRGPEAARARISCRAGAWVRAGGALLVVGNDDDPLQRRPRVVEHSAARFRHTAPASLRAARHPRRRVRACSTSAVASFCPSVFRPQL